MIRLSRSEAEKSSYSRTVRQSGVRVAPSWTPVYQTDRDIHWLIISGAKCKPCHYE